LSPLRRRTPGQEALIRLHETLKTRMTLNFFSNYNLIKQEAPHEH
jgi:hypothetical protein